jgi:hypothetical protein
MLTTHQHITCMTTNMKQSAQQDVEQPIDISRHLRKARITQCVVLGISFLLVFIVLPVVIVLTKKTSNNKTQWQDISPSSQLNATHTIIAGEWGNLLAIVGTDTEGNGMIEIHKYGDDARWGMLSSVSLGKDIIVKSMAISVHGTRMAVCTMQPLRVIVYDYIDGYWKQYGETMYGKDLVANTTTTSEELTGTTPNVMLSDGTTPNVMLSDEGRNLAFSFQTRSSQDGTNHIFTDVNSLGGQNKTGGVWKRKGSYIQNLQKVPPKQGSFATHTAMDGDGQKIAVSGDNGMTVYEWTEEGEAWLLTAEYDESPLPSSGSLAISRDGSTIAIGSYNGKVDGSGELSVINKVWPWFLYNNENPWLIEGKNGPKYDPLSAAVHVSLSGKGDHVLIGRQSNHDKERSLQVYYFDDANTEWKSRGLPFGQEQTNYQTHIAVDISDDGTKVASAIDGKVYVHMYVG